VAYTRVKTWSDAPAPQYLTNEDLNAEFDAVVAGINAVAAAMIRDAAITGAAFAPDSVTAAKLASGAIFVGRTIYDAAVNETHIPDAAIDGDHYEDSFLPMSEVAVVQVSERTLSEGSGITLPHGLTDEAGSPRAPTIVIPMISYRRYMTRLKTVPPVETYSEWQQTEQLSGAYPATNAPYGGSGMLIELAWDDTNIKIKKSGENYLSSPYSYFYSRRVTLIAW